ncbi:LuxR C-terminal-related transcriptional regulator [Microbacterium sp. NPDC055903]
MGDAVVDDLGVDITPTIDMLVAAGHPVAPHVLRRVHRALGDDRIAVVEMAAELAQEQRSGVRPLPDPLPCTAGVEAAFAGLLLDERDREALLIVALSSRDESAPLLSAIGRGAEELRSSALADLLALGPSGFGLRDPRLAVWIIDRSGERARAAAHERLSAAFDDVGDHHAAAWHAARAAAQKVPSLVPTLLSIARARALRGDAYAAFRVASEAFHHAAGGDVDAARLLAGRTALGAGLIEEAADWLGSLWAAGPGAAREDGLAALVVAGSILTGSVPVQDPSARRPLGAQRRAWRSWGRTAAMAAIMSAERHDTAAMRIWLRETRDADRRAGAGGVLLDQATALCDVMSAERPRSDGRPGTAIHAVATGISAGLHGDVSEGLRLLGAADPGNEPLIVGSEHSPLAAAYRAIAEVLLHYWEGDLAAARRLLQHAAEAYPVSLPFAGLGVHLARRLDIAILGEEGALSSALAAGLPQSIRLDAHLDRSIEAYLAGDVEQAEAHARLWSDLGAAAPVFGGGGIVEVGPPQAPVVPEGEEAALARVLCHRIRVVAAASWNHEYAAIAEQTRRVRSPFLRGRVEALLGTTCAIRGDPAAGRRHLLLARNLFEDAGADAWRASADARLERLADEHDAAAAAVPDPLAACRAVWAELLTERELQVAMLIVSGAANKDVAETLGVSVRTVEVHVGRIFDKLGVRKRVELTALAHRTNRFV